MGSQYPTFKIKNFEELDTFVKKYIANSWDNLTGSEFLAAHQLDFISFVQMFGSSPPQADPFSTEYASWEMKFFEFLSGRPYDFNNEGLKADESRIDIDVARMMSSPPQIDLSPAYKASLYKTYADILHFIQPQPGQRILEMGCGWGYLLEVLGRCGCEIFGIEASKCFVGLASRLLQAQLIKFQIHQGTFYDVVQLPGLFDIVIFQSSFHHVGDPICLLNHISKKMAQNGKLVLFNEPIQPGYDRPWGIVRYDGESLLQIRHRGWLEFGYRTDFFLELLQRSGFRLTNNPTLHDGTLLFEFMKAEDIPDSLNVNVDTPAGKEETKTVEGLNRIDVVNAYKFILGREPENEGVIEGHLNYHNNIAELRDAFLASQEFQSIFSKLLSFTIDERRGK